MTISSNPDFLLVYQRLADILRGVSGSILQIKTTEQGNVELIGPPTSLSKGKEVWLGAVRIGKRYVSYYLMPVYAYPQLLDAISPELKKHMQGKSCFNFTRVDEKLFQELSELTQRGFERFKEKGWIV